MRRFAFVLSTFLAACSSDSKTAARNTPVNGDGGVDGSTLPLVQIDRSGLHDLGTGPLDYSDANLWLCRPGIDPNECHGNLDATEVKKDDSRDIVHRTFATNPKFDCFYVYPTVSLGASGNVTDYTDITPVLDPLLSQAAPFASLCEVYAPLYRQVSLGGGGADGGVGLSGDTTLAYGDVESAFRYYLSHWNNGRKFVLIGHSQGTLMLTELVQKLIDTDAGLRSQMISALLIGGLVTVKANDVVGGSFQNVPGCTTAGQTGCVVAYNSFAKEAPPGPNAVFGRAPAGSETLCSPLASLGNNPGRMRGSYLPMVIRQAAFKPDGFTNDGFTTPFALYRDFFSASCVYNAGAHYLEVSVDEAADDQRPVPPYRSSVTEAIGFGLHVADFNIPQDDLIEIVSLQADAALK
jgi:hypothetical protein